MKIQYRRKMIKETVKQLVLDYLTTYEWESFIIDNDYRGISVNVILRKKVKSLE